MPCCSANSPELVIFLLFILDAHFLLRDFFPDTADSILVIVGAELSESASLVESAPSSCMLEAGLNGRGENVPWLQGPSWTCSSSSLRSRAVVSVGNAGLLFWKLGPATGGAALPSRAGGREASPVSDDAPLEGVKLWRNPLGWAGAWSLFEPPVFDLEGG